MSGGGGGSTTSTPPYQPATSDQKKYWDQIFGTGGAAQNIYSAGTDPSSPENLGNLIGLYNQIGLQGLNAPTQNLYSNVANAANMGLGSSAMMSGVGNQMLGGVPGLENVSNMTLANQLSQIPGLEQYASMMGQQAFDPQGDLRNRLYQQQEDAARAQAAASGLSGPAAMGVETQQMGNFIQDWQNQQLARQVQGTQGLQNLYSTMAGLPTAAATISGMANQQAQVGQGLGTQAFDLAGRASMLPYETQQGVVQNQMNLLNQIAGGRTNAYNQQLSGMNALQSYLNQVDAASGAATQAAQQNLNSQQAGINDVMGGLGILTSMMGK
jgi:hypothetical protein